VVTILPLTKREGKERRIYTFEVLLGPEVIGTGHESVVMPQQIRTISKARLLDRIGSLSDERLQTEIENRVLEHLGIAFEVKESEDG
ncbi:MAG: type II toxin-antitoxin system PemK/MazF family toxin, partial [Longimicrobiales bacterium]|nr:type II toxin-antitoxin system PemK/MazF family toxin [Longimicrobiales bacterium]